MSRIVYEVTPSGGLWKAERDGKFFGQWPTKETAEEAAKGRREGGARTGRSHPGKGPQGGWGVRL
jgi:hypothetical protein